MTDTELATSSPERLVQDFASRGLLVLPPESLGIPADVHERIYTKEKAAVDAGEPVRPVDIPEVLEVINAPGLVAACDRLVGPNWAIVPFTHNASFMSRGRDQHWHKDDNGPYNSRKQRHHQAVQIEMLYYPQAVRQDMGPTATVPYSHYWAFDHEENHDNFAGGDHLDFAYHISGMEARPVSGPDSEYDEDDIVHRRTAHDVRMREAVTGTGWPLVHQLEAPPLRAGSVVLYSHNTFHRGNHRRDDWRTWPDNPRFMWRFWLYRTTGPTGCGTAAPKEGHWNGVDTLTGTDLSSVSDDVTTVWRYHDHWMRTGAPPPARADVETLSNDDRTLEAERLFGQLHEKGEASEPARVGAAYKLASIGDAELAARVLGKALHTERESVRRAATYGLIAVGAAATPVLLEATRSAVKWVRKAGVHGLGDAGPLVDGVLGVVVDRLEQDTSMYVRAVAAGSLGCLGRRAVATGEGADLVPACLEALMACLGREPNRLAMDRAQGRSIKFVRPTDECDVCEGSGVDFGLERFEPVRSVVRENALWSAVILCSHGAAVTGAALEPAIDGLTEVIRGDRNAICVGYAMDALTRLTHLRPQDEPVVAAIERLQARLPEILRLSPIRGWEALVRGGLTSRSVAEVEG